MPRCAAWATTQSRPASMRWSYTPGEVCMGAASATLNAQVRRKLPPIAARSSSTCVTAPLPTPPLQSKPNEPDGTSAAASSIQKALAPTGTNDMHPSV